MVHESEQRILGVDPGLNITGYAVIAAATPNRIAVVEAGVIRGGSAKLQLADRLKALRDGLDDVIRALRPGVMALEDLYSHYKRPQTAVLMGHARGVLCLVAADRNLPVHHYPATRIKRALTGNGHAPKSQIQQTVVRLLNLPQIPEPPDVADALAIALCHCYHCLKRPDGCGGSPHARSFPPAQSGA
jgi:crossover junction endodeoxyribonuclease RuvC